VALAEALAASKEVGVTTELIDLRNYELPRLNAVETNVPDAERLREIINRADSVLLGTPNYHGSYSGVLKNALDYCGHDEFEGTTIGLLEVAAGEFPGSALMHLRTVSRTLRAWTLPTEVAIPDSHSIVDETRIKDRDVAERTHRLGRELALYAGVAAYPDMTARVPAIITDGEANH
jgi:NAD(P)H-dependent FMN reductase